MKPKTETSILKGLACVTRYQRVCGRTAVLNWGDSAPRGQLARLETFLVVLTAGGGGATAANHRTKHNTAPPPRRMIWLKTPMPLLKTLLKGEGNHKCIPSPLHFEKAWVAQKYIRNLQPASHPVRAEGPPASDGTCLGSERAGVQSTKDVITNTKQTSTSSWRKINCIFLQSHNEHQWDTAQDQELKQRR